MTARPGLVRQNRLSPGPKHSEELMIDFFAGSGTTLNAVQLLNLADGGRRRCIQVTNNEVGDKAAEGLRALNHEPGDPAW